MNNVNQNYIELPIQRFIGGNSEIYIYEMMDDNNMPIDLSGATAKFTLSNFSTKTVIFSKTCEIIQETNDIVHYPYKIQVRLETTDTINLCGEYIQQITITDFFGKQKLPAEGRIIIIRNTEPIEGNRFWYNDIQAGSFHASPSAQTLPMGSSFSAKLYYISKATQKLSMPIYSQLTFSTTNPAVAKVINTPSSGGVITAVGVGQCDIYVSVTASPSIYAKIAITVEQPNTKWYDDIKTGTFRAIPSSINLSKSSVQHASIFYISKAINVDLSPPYTKLLFETSKESIATVDSNGLIFGVANGTCNIVVSVCDKPTIKTQIAVIVT